MSSSALVYAPRPVEVANDLAGAITVFLLFLKNLVVISLHSTSNGLVSTLEVRSSVALSKSGSSSRAPVPPSSSSSRFVLLAEPAILMLPYVFYVSYPVGDKSSSSAKASLTLFSSLA